MQVIISTILSMLLFLISAPLVLTTDVEVTGIPNTINGLPVGTIGFVGTFEGLEGVTITANGTLNEIFAQAQRDHPEWKPNFTHPGHRGPPVDRTLISRAENVGLEQEHKEQIYCWPLAGRPDLQRADSYWVDRLIELMVAVKAEVYVPRRTCNRFVCLGDATAYLCNENDREVHFNSWLLATYVGDIRYTCLTGWNGKTGLVCGLETDTDRWYVHVNKQIPNC
ncbi:hypothetical protein BKA64DRAFT_713875 [Cadophora sp. MPI-SDFR-AT-0126]|nr:hypothetical protein BKA64DRAFT_713875 [Leotiomycetes sp. MPI-SDFR-AT-0126]